MYLDRTERELWHATGHDESSLRSQVLRMHLNLVGDRTDQHTIQVAKLAAFMHRTD